MYIPPANLITDHDTIAAFTLRHTFATLVTHDGKAPFASHLPVLFYPDEGAHGTLVAHMARANPQWRHFENAEEVLVIFQGPHAYISPAWYETEPAVPTWNYAAVHAWGIARLVTEPERVVAILEEIVEFFEAPRKNRWLGRLPTEYRDKMMGGIVAFEIRITRLEAKFKLSQNRPSEDIDGAIATLAQSQDQTERELAEMMRAAAR